MKKKFKWWLIPLCVAGVPVIAFGIYAAVIFARYYRIEDNVPLISTGRAESKAKTGEEYTAVTYNIGFGAYTPDYSFFMDGGKYSRAFSKESVIECTEGVAQTAFSFDPDIVFFQEVDTDADRSYHVDQVPLIMETFASSAYDEVFAVNYHSDYLFYPFHEPIGASDSGIFTLSRFDVTSAVRRSLPIAAGPKKIVDLDRCYSVTRCPVENGRELVIINTHLSAYGTDQANGNAQLQMIFDDMAAEYEKGNYVICGGDFNHDFTGDSREKLNPGTDRIYSWCQPFPESMLPEGFTMCRDYEGELIGTTRYADIPYDPAASFTVTIDGFIASDNIRCGKVKILDNGYIYSDHLPVIMTFELEE